MKTDLHTTRGKFLLTAMSAAFFALFLGACERETSPGGMSQDADRGAEITRGEPLPPANSADAPADQVASPSPRTPATTGKSPVDSELAARIRAALSADPILKSLPIDVEASNGIVTLYGSADTPANRDKATEVASRVPGVSGVINKMTVVSGS